MELPVTLPESPPAIQLFVAPRMKPLRFTDRFKTLYTAAIQLSQVTQIEAVLLLLDGPADWARLKNLSGNA
ncbi:MAG: hypothetical protein KJZ87_26430, partial [Thermoguttaceae bacterium]|nr:hypothetical protein [Thermoguttaceae bacterium]